MTDVIFFSNHNTDNWWKYLAENLQFTQSTCTLSDIRGEGDICVVDDFYEHLHTKDCGKLAIDYFSKPVCDEIIRRCRVLRNLKTPQALSMIGAMYLAFDAVIQKEKPKLVVSFIIDRYVMDVLNRVLQSNQIPFLGMTASIVPDYVMFMVGGQLLSLRSPEIAEVEKSREQLLSESFTPSYVANSTQYGYLKYWRIFLYFKLRGVVFDLIRRLKRDKLNLHYLDALNHLDHKPRWLDYKVLQFFKPDWQQRLGNVPQSKRVFLALQLLPEASLDYWLNDLSLLDNDSVVLKMCDVLGKAGFTLLIKDHPLQFGFRKRELIQALAKLPHVILAPYDVPATRLIKECSVSVTLTGTVGFQSAVAGVCSVVSGAYYSDEDHFIHFHTLDEIDLLPEKIDLFQKNNKGMIEGESIDALLTKVLAASAPGDLFSFRRFDKNEPDHTRRVANLLESFNKYLPQFLVNQA